MADLDAIYSAYNEITDAKDNAAEHQDAYNAIIAASQGSEGAKRLAAQFIPTFFKFFPTLHTKAIDGVFDLCEDDSSLVTLAVVEVLAVLFRQGVKGADLRERTLDFITNHVMTCKEALFKDPEIEMFFLEEMQKAMGSVSNVELEIFAKIIMQTRPYQSGELDLKGLLNSYVAHITSEKPFDRGISADPLLEFIGANVLPLKVFSQLTDKQKTSILRLYVDSITTGHPSASTLKTAGKLSTDILLAVVSAEQESTAIIEFTQVECLTNVLYLLATKEPELIEKEDLTRRFRNLYMSTQLQISNVRQALTAAQAKQPQDAEQAATIKGLKKTIAIHSNIHTVVKEFLKPKHLRSTKLALHPSWKPLPEPVKPPGPVKPAKPVAGGKATLTGAKAATTAATTGTGPKATAVTAKAGEKANTKLGSKAIPAQQQQQQQQQQQPPQQQHGGLNKRKSEQEASAKPKKPKIVRRHGSNVGGGSPGSSSPGGHGGAGVSTQPMQGSHSKRGSIGRGQGSPSSSFDGRRGRESNGKINFLKR
ncbi:Apoptosis inhibitor 5 [Dissophora globulifera]|nr:Apoptosis inhibitor 5 [Dissophora globulifera]